MPCNEQNNFRRLFFSWKKGWFISLAGCDTLIAAWAALLTAGGRERGGGGGGTLAVAVAEGGTAVASRPPRLRFTPVYIRAAHFHNFSR